MPKHALKSMTGFAEARVEHNGWCLRVDVKSVNHRFLDLRLRLPQGFESFEPRIRQLLRERLRRGHVDLVLHCEPTGAAAVQVNREVALAYLRAADELRRQFGMKAEPDLIALLRLPGVIAAESPADGQERERLGERLISCLGEALARLEEMREAEGRVLAEEMEKGLRAVSQGLQQIEALAERAAPAYAARLAARLRQLLGEIPLDAARLSQEAALLAERADVTEELQRLRSHLQQFGKLLRASDEVGKKLDFLLQEMQRETNAILSKTPGVEADGVSLTGFALELKSGIEKLREQAQNIE